MKFSSFALMKLAEMICGDVKNFPYRSSSYLTMFFESLNFGYVHDGSTRRYWVKDVLEELNVDNDKDGRFPSSNLVRVIEYILHPEHFLGNHEVIQDAAAQDLNTLLKINGLQVVPVENSRFGLRTSAMSARTNGVSPATTGRRITCEPKVFQIPQESAPNRANKIAVMMPFSAEFGGTWDAIHYAAKEAGFDCIRADQIWESPTFIQDIFNLIYGSQIIVADLTRKNPNVMYELGIAHTLGREVIPVTQSITDVPSDILHHRVLAYLPNRQGLEQLSDELLSKLNSLKTQK